MARITTKATAVVNFEANTKELDKFYKNLQKQLSNVSISDSLSKDFQAAQIELQNILKQAGSVPAEDMTPDLATEFIKRYQKIYSEIEKLNKRLLKETTQSTTVQIDQLEKELVDLNKNIAVKEKDLESLKNKFPEDSPDSGTVGFGSDRTEMRFTKKLAEDEGLLEKMKGSSGNLITNFRTMLENADAIKESFEEVDSANKKINEGLKKGLSFKEISKSLSKDEKEDLNNILKQNNQKLSVEQAIEQIQIKRTLDLKKANHLHEKQVQIGELQEEVEVGKEQAKQKQLKIDKALADISRQTAPEQQKIVEAYKALSKNLNEVGVQGAVSLKDLQKSTKDARKSQESLNEEVKKSEGTFARAGRQVFSYGIAFTALRRIYRETLRTIRDLDSALTEMAIVTSMNRNETWELVGTMQNLAKETGFTTTEIAKLSTIYFRQGRTLREVIELTRVAAQAARIAGISAAESANFLTSAVNAFQLSADQALEVSDKFAALAAQSASSYEELAVGLSKFAAQANVAGVSIDFAMGLLSKGVETTREAPETIGTALKTVIARMRELTDLGKTFEDGMDISRVETALRQVGVALRDENGQFRNLELVLTELGGKFETLNTNQQASVAVALAGTRQQSRLIAVMQDFDRTLELVDISQQSAGATTAQQAQFMKGMEAATISLQNAYQKFITTITDSELIISIVRGLAGALDGLSTILTNVGISGKVSMVAMAGLFTVLKAKVPISNLIINLNNREIVQQQRLNAIKAIEQKMLITENLLKNSIMKTEAKNLLLEKQKTLSKERLLLLNTKELIQEKLMFLIDKTKRKQLIANINLQFKENLAKVGTIGINKMLFKSTLTLTKGFIGLAKVMLLTPIGWLAIGIGILIKGFMDLKNGNDTLAASFASSFSSIFAVTKNLFSSVMSLLGAFTGLSKVLKPIIGIMLLPLLTVLTGLSLAFDTITFLVNKAIVQIERFTNWIKQVSSESKLFTGVLNILKDAVEGVTSFFGFFADAMKDQVEETNREVKILTTSYKDLADAISKARKETEAENYQLLQRNNNFQKLIDEYEEIQNIRASGFFGEEDLEREKALLQELANLDEEFVARDGVTINQAATINLLQSDIQKNSETIANNLLEIAERALELAEKDFSRFLSGEGGGLQDIQNLLISFVDEDLTQNQVTALENYYERLLSARGSLSREDLLDLIENESIQESTESLTNAITEFDEALSSNENGIMGAKNAFEEISETLDEETLPVFKELYRDLDAVFTILEDKTEPMQESMIRVLNTIGSTSDILGALSSSLEATNLDLEQFLMVTGNMADQILETNQNMSESEAASQAIIMVAGSFEDAATAATLYSLAIGRSLLEATQAADLLASRINNLAEVQKNFLEGSLSDQELFEFVEEYSEFFGDPNFFRAFQQGLDLSSFLIKDAIEQSEEYRTQLFAVTQQLKSYEDGVIDLTDEQANALRAEQNRLLILNSYQGALKGVTESQMAYNNSLKAFNLLSRFGFEATSAQINKIDALKNNIGPALKLATEQLEGTEEAIQRILNEDGQGITANQIYDIVDGVVVLKDAYDDLEPAVQELIDTQINFVESGLEGIYSIFETLMNETVELEKNMAEERIKVYEDYFSALDRLEEQRARKVQREDLVTQLSRLEGATDEASRKKALDLRRELNQLDEQTAEETLKESREGLIESINESVKRIKDTFEQVFKDFISSGESSGEALYNKLVAAGLAKSSGSWEDIEAKFVVPDITPPEIPDVDFNQDQIDEMTATIDALTGSLSDPDITPEEAEEIQNEIDLLTEQRDELLTISGLLREGFNIPEEVVTDDGNHHVGDQLEGHASGMDPVENTVDTYEQRQADARAEFDEWLSNLSGASISPSSKRQAEGQKRAQLYRKYNIDSFRKGGMVDYNGLAMLHGSKSAPEAVLNPMQTEMFMGLRDALEKVSVDSNSSGNVNIEKIAISTESMNGNQDFKRAGETLAEAFKGAIQRKGITINTNKV